MTRRARPPVTALDYLGSKIWRIDVGMSHFCGGKPAVLEIQGDKVRGITSSDSGK